MVGRQQERLARRHMKEVFGAWRQHTMYKQSLADRFHTVMSRTINRRMILCLRSWRGHVEEKRLLAAEHVLHNEKVQCDSLYLMYFSKLDMSPQLLCSHRKKV
jgi:hypothetical protein